MEGIKKLWEDLNELDGASVASRVGIRYDDGEYLVPFLDHAYRVTPATHTIERATDPENAGPVVSTHLFLCMLSFLISGELRKPEKTWMTEKELPGGSVFFQGPHAMPIQPIIDAFGRNVEALVIRGATLGGTQSEFGDASIELSVLPGIRMCIAIWEADDEFPASCTIMFDRSFKGMFNLDIVYAIAASVINEFVRD